jgi:hypothetical protein
MIAVLITYVSSISAATTEALSTEFGVSLELSQLSTAIFLFGVSQVGQLLRISYLHNYTYTLRFQRLTSILDPQADRCPCQFSCWQFAFGALPVAPLSEKFGRQPIYLVTLLVSSVFTIGTGASRTFAQVLVTRFFAGASGGELRRSSTLSLVLVRGLTRRCRFLVHES